MDHQPGDGVEWCDPDQVDFYPPDQSPDPPIWRLGLVYEPDRASAKMYPGYVWVRFDGGHYALPPEYVRSAPRLPLEGL